MVRSATSRGRAGAAFYAAGDRRAPACRGGVAGARDRLPSPGCIAIAGTVCSSREPDSGHVLIGEGIPAARWNRAPRPRREPADPRLRAGRVGGGRVRLTGDIAAAAVGRARSLLPQGEDAEAPVDRRGGLHGLARLRVERREPLVAVGGGALGDAAGFSAAIPPRRPADPCSPTPRRPGRLVDRVLRLASTCPEGSTHRRVPPAGGDRRRTPGVASLDERQQRAGLGGGGQDGCSRGRAAVPCSLRGRVGRSREARLGIREGRWPRSVEPSAWAKVEVVLADEGQGLEARQL